VSGRLRARLATLLAMLAVTACAAVPTPVASPGPITPPAPGTPGAQAPSPEPSSSRRGRLVDLKLGTLTIEEAFASTTVEDWVREADHVAVVRITDEVAAPIPEVDAERGEGLIMRTVTGTVEAVAWSHPEVVRALPDTVRFKVFGWAFNSGGESRYRIGVPGQPYLLPGRTYLIALRWFQWGCPGRIDPGDEPTPPTFAPLGQGAIVPFDGVLGSGEFEGAWTDDAGSGDPAGSFRKALTGKSVEWVGEALAGVAAGDPSLGHKDGPIGCDAE
jgi:hypothetical protein